MDAETTLRDENRSLLRREAMVYRDMDDLVRAMRRAIEAIEKGRNRDAAARILRQALSDYEG